MTEAEAMQIVSDNPFAYWALMLRMGIDIKWVKDGFVQAAMDYGVGEEAALEMFNAIENGRNDI